MESMGEESKIKGQIPVQKILTKKKTVDRIRTSVQNIQHEHYYRYTMKRSIFELLN